MLGLQTHPAQGGAVHACRQWDSVAVLHSWVLRHADAVRKAAAWRDANGAQSVMATRGRQALEDEEFAALDDLLGRLAFLHGAPPDQGVIIWVCHSDNAL